MDLNTSSNISVGLTGIYGNDTSDMRNGREHWGFWVNFIATPIIVVIGIVGNTLSFMVMKSKQLRHKSYAHYLSALALFDTTTLIIRLVKTVDEYYVEHQNIPGLFQNFDDLSCKIYTFLENVAYLMSSWLVVLMAIERLFAVWFPFKNAIIRQESGAVITICGLVILVGVSQLFRPIMIVHTFLDGDSDIRVCLSALVYSELYTNLDVYYYQWTLTFVLPVTIVLVCNCLVLYRINKVRREIRDEEKCARHSTIVKQKHRTTCMLLIVSFTYIATLLPLFTLTVIIHVSFMVNGIAALTLFYSLLPYLNMCVAVSLLNYAVNFFIYIVSGKRFRFELGKMCYTTVKRGRSFTARSRRSYTARSTKDEVIRL